MELYVDLISSPTRACVLLCRLYELPVKEVQLQLMKGWKANAQFVEAIPLRKIPFLRDGSFGLPEACAILPYLTQVFKDRVPEHWYPTNLHKRTTVDALMHWHHSTLRAGSQAFEREYMIEARLRGRVREQIVQEGGKVLKQSLTALEEQFLKDTTFCSIPTANTDLGRLPSIADLLIACELESLLFLNYFPELEASFRDLHEFEGYPRIRQYLVNMRLFCRPHLQKFNLLLESIMENRKTTAKL